MADVLTSGVALFKSHKVIQWTLAYAALAYTLLHGVEMVGEALSWPHWIARVLMLILGVPIIAALVWYHGSKGSGHRRQMGRGYAGMGA